MVASTRKSTQRERLLAGMIAAANSNGYAHANVAAVISQAGVSRRTFYDYFSDRDDCFLAAIADIHERLAAEIGQAVAREAPAQALQAGITAILQFANREPVLAHYLMSETMGAGARAHSARDEGIGEIERILERARSGAPTGASTPDLCPRIVIGAIYRLLSSRLRRSEPALSGLIDDLLAWVESYSQPAGEQRWRTLQPTAAPPRSPYVPEHAPAAPTPLPPGRPARSREEVAENHRQRILYAAAQLAERKGYNATTIADITKAAGVDGRAFYASFTDKQDAFMAVHELGVQQVMRVTAAAFFAGANWPERVWEAGRAFTQLLETNTLIARVGFVEAHAVGPGACQRVEDSHIAFTIFLQEGYRQQPQAASPPSPLALEAIVATIFEIVYRQARKPGKPRISVLLAQMAHLALTPFLGVREANRFIESKL